MQIARRRRLRKCKSGDLVFTRADWRMIGPVLRVIKRRTRAELQGHPRSLRPIGSCSLDLAAPVSYLLLGSSNRVS